MVFNRTKYIDTFLSDYRNVKFSNNSVARVERVPASPRYAIIGIHKLTPDENRSKRNLFMEVVNANGKRVIEEIEWGWEEQKPSQITRPVKLDKPANEPAGNISLDWGQVVWARVKGKSSDKVIGVTTNLPDEGPEHWNTIGHFSYFVVWMWDEGGVIVPPIIPPVDDPDLPTTPEYERGFRDGVDLVKRMVQVTLDKFE